MQPCVLAVGLEALVDLAGQFAGGREHKHPAPLWLPRLWVGHHPLDERQGEGGGLARARLGTAEDVAAGEHVRHGLRLDRGRLGVALGKKRLEEGR